MFQTLTLAYDRQEDRIIATTDINTPASWSCWLTRRLALTFLNRTAEYLARTSPLAETAATEHRGDLVEFEREAALERTASATARADDNAINRNKASAELAVSMGMVDQGSGFRLELAGDRGGSASGELSRPLIQRILKALADECIRGEWAAAATGVATNPTQH
jgi:hypothetical protein